MIKTNQQTAALIVAAGLSSRMGQFKPMLPLGDSSIIRTIIGKLKSVDCDPIILVTGHRADELTRHLADLGLTTVHNPDFASTDMFTSVKLGLAVLNPTVERFFFSPGDVPLFSMKTLQTMSRQMDEDKKSVIIPVHDGRRGHPILIRGALIPRLLTYRGPMGLKGALKTLEEEVGFLKVSDLGITLDADRPQDYQRLLDLLDSTPSKS